MQNKTKLVGSLIPQYHLSSGISNLDIVKALKNLLNNKDLLNENLPEYILKQENLISYRESIENIHFPKDVKS